MRQHVDGWLILIAAAIVGLVVLGLSDYLGGAGPAPLP